MCPRHARATTAAARSRGADRDRRAAELVPPLDRARLRRPLCERERRGAARRFDRRCLRAASRASCRRATIPRCWSRASPAKASSAVCCCVDRRPAARLLATRGAGSGAGVAGSDVRRCGRVTGEAGKATDRRPARPRSAGSRHPVPRRSCAHLGAGARRRPGAPHASSASRHHLPPKLRAPSGQVNERMSAGGAASGRTRAGRSCGPVRPDLPPPHLKSAHHHPHADCSGALAGAVRVRGSDSAPDEFDCLTSPSMRTTRSIGPPCFVVGQEPAHARPARSRSTGPSATRSASESADWRLPFSWPIAWITRSPLWQPHSRPPPPACCVADWFVVLLVGGVGRRRSTRCSGHVAATADAADHDRDVGVGGACLLRAGLGVGALGVGVRLPDQLRGRRRRSRSDPDRGRRESRRREHRRAGLLLADWVVALSFDASSRRFELLLCVTSPSWPGLSTRTEMFWFAGLILLGRGVGIRRLVVVVLLADRLDDGRVVMAQPWPESQDRTVGATTVRLSSAAGAGQCTRSGAAAPAASRSGSSCCRWSRSTRRSSCCSA